MSLWKAHQVLSRLHNFDVKIYLVCIFIIQKLLFLFFSFFILFGSVLRLALSEWKIINFSFVMESWEQVAFRLALSFYFC